MTQTLAYGKKKKEKERNEQREREREGDPGAAEKYTFEPT